MGEDWSVDELADAVVTTILGPVVIVVGLFALIYFNSLVDDVISSWLGRVAGLTAWKKRTGFHARKLGHPGTYYAAAFGLLAGVAALGCGALMVVRPPTGIQPTQALLILFLGIALLLVASLISALWWRISSRDLP